MSSINRHDPSRAGRLVAIGVGASVAAIAVRGLLGRGKSVAHCHDDPGKDASSGVTRTLARYAATAPVERVPDAVRQQAVRTLVNWVGCAVGGSREDAPVKALAALGAFAGREQACLFGRTERTDVLLAALINGISSHVLDFDDTQLATVIHPAGPVASALTAFAQYRPVSGAEFMNALVIGCEVECRIGRSVYPEHYEMGWHITGTTGVFGAAAAVGRLLGLDEERMGWALGLAASQPVGLKVQFGSDTKSFHPARAAQSGLVAALMASQGYTAAVDALEGVYGWGQVLSTRHDWSCITDGLGSRYEIAENTYKPFACGIVSHPAIDAGIQLRKENKLKPERIKSVEIKVNPLVLKLMGKKAPRTGLEGKFSIYYVTAAALVTGEAGPESFTDQAVGDATVKRVRDLVTATTDPLIATDQAKMTITLTDGRTVEKSIEHAIGSEANPMSDAQLDEKFMRQCRDILPTAKAEELLNACRNAWSLDDAGVLGRLGAVN